MLTTKDPHQADSWEVWRAVLTTKDSHRADSWEAWRAWPATKDPHRALVSLDRTVGAAEMEVNLT